MKQPASVLGVAVLTINLIVTACEPGGSGESAWEQNSGRSNHVSQLKSASYPDDFIESYDEKYELLDHCFQARDAKEYHRGELAEVLCRIDEGETENSFGFALLRDRDRQAAKALAAWEWMEQHSCTGHISP